MGDIALSPSNHLTLGSVFTYVKPWQFHLYNRNNNIATSQGYCEDEMRSSLLVLSYPYLASPILTALERTNITTNFNRKRSRTTKEIFKNVRHLLFFCYTLNKTSSHMAVSLSGASQNCPEE